MFSIQTRISILTTLTPILNSFDIRLFFWWFRNNRCFENISCSSAQLQELILLRIGWWCKNWGLPFPYSPNEVARNPLCLDWNPTPSIYSSISHTPNQGDWIPPPQDGLKWNIDASMKVSESKSAVGGVLRNHLGKFICLFSCPVPFLDINHGEVFAIHRALKISSSMDWSRQSRIILESDSVNAVKWCRGESDGPWNLAFTINFIKNAIASSGNIEIVHKGRESNLVADSLAKQGLSRSDDFIAWI